MLGAQTPKIMLKIIRILLLLVIFSVGIGTLATKTIVAYELKGVSQKAQLRELTDQEKWHLHLYEEVIRKGLGYSDYRLLQRIAEAESHFQQYDKNGSVLLGYINNKDTGIFQLNQKFHLKAAQDLGIDIFEPYGNIEYAVYIYKKDGSGHWNWSKSKWQ